MGIRPEQIVMSLEGYGNTSAASIPLALNDVVADGTVTPGSTMVFCGFGAGLAVATAVVRWNAVDQRTIPNYSETVSQAIDAMGANPL
jgi:3-oxoacyl-[acyl-carrier-protein] synthase-3